MKTLINFFFIGIITLITTQISKANIFEAESATLVGVGSANTLTGYSGSGYIDAATFEASGDKIIFQVNVAEAGEYPCKIRYWSPADKYNYVSINGTVNSELFPANNTWSDVSLGSVFLNAGDNTIEIEKHWGWMNIDYLEVEGITSTTNSPPPPPSPPSTANTSLWNGTENAGIYTNANKVGINTNSLNKTLNVHAASPDDGILVTAEGKATQVQLQVAGGDYGYLSLGGNTKLRGNGQKSHFMGKLGVGTTNPYTTFDIHTPSGNDGMRISAEGKSTIVKLLVAEGDYGYLNLGGETTLRGNGQKSHFMGKLGIGTTSPDNMLHIHGQTGNKGVKITADNKSTLVHLLIAEGDYGYLALGGDTKLRGNGKTSNFEGTVTWGDYEGMLSRDQGASLELGGAGTPYIDFINSTGFDYDMRFMLVDNNTMVLRGNNSGQKKFVVEGKIGAQEVRVSSNGWADYVFEENYDLKSLEEVEAFIDAEGHLPNVPKESQVVEEGIDVGEMMTVQQEKIEELFLHVIELNKQVEKLMEENEHLKSEK